MKQNVKLLDCTLRDGGYYNNWDFELPIARRTISDLQSSGIDIVEMGYKSPGTKGFAGLFRYCNEGFLDFLREFEQAEFAFMLDVKDFVIGRDFDADALDSLILDKNRSVFSWVRLATHFDNISVLPKFCKYLRNRGYFVSINLMGITLLSNEELNQALVNIESARPEVFYFADSFGSMTPSDVTRLIEQIRTGYSGALGIHTHDSQGLAFANTLAAIESGVEFVDSTITGMGRGAGNLHTEQLLLYMQSVYHGKVYRPNRLLDLVHDFYGPMKEKHGWGYNYVYMISGLNNIHPSYCMAISDGNKFTMSQVSQVLESIPHASRSSFDQNVLAEAINTLGHGREIKGQRLPRFKLATKNEGDCLIVTPGPNIQAYQEALDNVISRHSLILIECNDTHILNRYPDRIVAVLNRMRLDEMLETNRLGAKVIVSGESSIARPPPGNLFHYPYRLGKFEVGRNELRFPAFEAGQYAISLAVALGCKKIYLAGFLGYEDEGRREVMDSFFAGLTDRIELVSLTPTHYSSLKQRSVYQL